MNLAFLLLAGGKGERFGEKKQWKPLKGKSLILYSLEFLNKNPLVSDIFIGIPEEDEIFAKKLIKDFNISKVRGFFYAGKERRDTVFNGLLYIKDKNFDLVGIHDAARPFIKDGLIEESVKILAQNPEIDGVIPVIPIYDTIKKIDKNNIKTIDRKGLFRVQTPQIFRAKPLIKAYKKVIEEEIEITDDASALEIFGGKIVTIEGDELNFKITTRRDWEMAELILNKPKIGWGYDIHRTKEGKGLWLGGIFIPCDITLVGHSDADPVLHAIADALLGALCQGDIGEWFPDTDPKYKRAKSASFLKEILNKNPSINISNIDITVITEKPKLKPYKDKIAESVSHILKIPKNRVNIKAKTKEGLDATGEGKAIECVASVLII